MLRKAIKVKSFKNNFCSTVFCLSLSIMHSETVDIEEWSKKNDIVFMILFKLKHNIEKIRVVYLTT